jgi:hypothetical protein
LKGWGDAGRYRPSIVVVASREPGTPVVCCPITGTVVSRKDRHAKTQRANATFKDILLKNNMGFILS